MKSAMHTSARHGPYFVLESTPVIRSLTNSLLRSRLPNLRRWNFRPTGHARGCGCWDGKKCFVMTEGWITLCRAARSLHPWLSHRMTTPRLACTSDFDPLPPDIAVIASANMRSTSGSSCLEPELVELELRNISV
jgi:hypothetical protein